LKGRLAAVICFARLQFQAGHETICYQKASLAAKNSREQKNSPVGAIPTGLLVDQAVFSFPLTTAAMVGVGSASSWLDQFANHAASVSADEVSFSFGFSS
jgi:hypothetical protein